MNGAAESETCRAVFIPVMRTSEEIDAEIAKLRALLDAKNENNYPRYILQTRQIISAQIDALNGRFTEERVVRTHYTDENDPDYRDGANDIYHEVERAVNWMRGVASYKAPSEDA